MGILSWITGQHFDEQDDGDESTSWCAEEEDEGDANNYERGQAYARATIEERRHNYQQQGYDSFREAVQTGGEIWHRIVQQEQEQVNRGHAERQGQLEYAKGARSMYD